MTAEESTAWPGVSRPTDAGGLGFTFRGTWAGCTTRSTASHGPSTARWHHDELTFSMCTWGRGFVLPLSHDEVVHGRAPSSGSSRATSGSSSRRCARSTRTHVGAIPESSSCSWAGSSDRVGVVGGRVARLVRAPTARCTAASAASPTSRAYRAEPALASRLRPRWIPVARRGRAGGQRARCPVLGRRLASAHLPRQLLAGRRHHWRVPLPVGGRWREVVNTDAAEYGGSGVGNLGGVAAVARPMHAMVLGA